MEFLRFKKQVQENFKSMTEGVNHLFEVDLDKDKLWNLYLDSFPAGTNEMFRQRREYDCSCCRQFIKNVGNVVSIKNGVVTTVWDIETDCTTFGPVTETLRDFVKSKAVSDVWINKFKKLGVDSNYENAPGTVAILWEHFYLEVPEKLVDKSSKSEGEIRGNYLAVRNVFKRSLDEITIDSIDTVLDLISQNSLDRGLEWEESLIKLLQYKNMYEELKTREDKDLFAWEKSVEAGPVVGKIRNHSIGTLLVNISENMELDIAVSKYDKIVCGDNYKRSKPIYSQRMLDKAKEFAIENGFMESLERRFATLDDIKVNNVLFCNRDSAKRVQGSIFDEMSQSLGVNIKKLSKIEEISIEKFIDEILPTAKEVEVFVENNHANNFVSLIAPVNTEAKNLMKWGNPFGWAYTGNIALSSMKDRVKMAGGNVEGVLRFSIQWNDDKYDGNDLDAHCKEPGGNHIYFGNKENRSTSGKLDVDIIHPNKGEPAVENITWTDLSKMEEGSHLMYVEDYTYRGGTGGFKAEIEFNGEIHSFVYNQTVRSGEKIIVAEVIYSKANGFTIVPKLDSTTSSKEVWGVKTQQFVPVSVVMYSPNYWDNQKEIGHKHYMFMLKDCKNPENPNGFYNEFLKQEFMEHRKVFEALGSKMSVGYVEDQLSGLGFSSTKRSEVVVKVKGTFERVLKVKF